MAEGMELLVLVLVLARAVYTDVKKGIIENRLVVFGLLAGVGFRFFEGGLPEVLFSLRTAGLIVLSLFFLFVLKGLGAGDIKLFCMIAVFLREKIILVVILSFFAGAVIAITKMAVRFLKKEKIYIRNEQMNFSIPVVIATVIAILEEMI